MIINLFLDVLKGVLAVLLAPISVLNWTIDVVSKITIVNQFVKVVAYFFPWKELLPLVVFIIAMFIFRAVISLIKTIWELIPLL